MRFTESQLAAVSLANFGSDTCVVAGPGSGKTTVLVEYYRNLISSGVDPLRILAITFTEKAAAHMRAKLAEAFEDNASQRARLERAWVSTVHGFCSRLLRENAVFAGVDPEFRVLDERESARFQHLAARDALDGMYHETPERLRCLIRGLASKEIDAAVLGVYDALRCAGVRIIELRGYRTTGTGMAEVLQAIGPVCGGSAPGWSESQLEHLAEIRAHCQDIVRAQGPAGQLRALAAFGCNLNKLRRGHALTTAVRELRERIGEATRTLITEWYAAERETLFTALERFDTLYRERKQAAGALDFSDLEEYAVRLLEANPGVRRRLQGQFDQVLMDEFQDTNGQQARLLDLVRAPGRFYAVGDINQSIYGFRHAEPRVFQEYRDAVESGGQRLVELADNFRSRTEILDAVAIATGSLPGIEPRPLAARKEFASKSGPFVEVLGAKAEDIASAQRLEARWVAHRILELGPEFDFRGIAVLVRNSEVMADFAEAFDAAGIPCVVSRGKGFYENREIADLVHLLRVIANPCDEISMAAVLRSPFVNLPDEELLRLKLSGGFETGLPNAQWRAARHDISFDRLLLRAIDEMDYRPASGARGQANIEKFLAQARDASGRMTLEEFVDDLDLLRKSNPREPDAPPEDSANAVQLMTVHAAKGLEFPVVFVSALHKGTSQDIGGISFSPAIGLGARWRHPFAGGDKDDLFQAAIRAEHKQKERDESNRLLYVAMTRAEERLVLSFACGEGKPENWAGIVSEALAGAYPVGWVTRTPETVRIETGREGAEAQIVPAPAVDLEGYDSNVNVTALAQFARCPRCYYLTRYVGQEPMRALDRVEEGGSGRPDDAAEFGRQVHAVLAGMAVPDPDPAALRMADCFRSSPLGRRASRAVRAEREFDFLIAIEDVVVRGQIDLWFEDNGELVLVDYKTDHVSAAESPKRAQEYAVQLRLYALALERVVGRIPDRAYIYLLRPNIAVPVGLAPSLVDSPEGLIRDLKHAQATGLFPPSEGCRCSYGCVM